MRRCCTGTPDPAGRPGRMRLGIALAALGMAATAVTAAAVPARAVLAGAHAPALAGAHAPAAAGTAHSRDLLTGPEAIAQAKRAGKPVAVTGATTGSSTLTANPDGTLTLDETNLPVRKDVNGTWQPLDATLHRNAGGTVSPAVTTAALTLSGGGTGPLASMTVQGHTLSLTLPWKLPAPALSGATATYANVPAPGIDLKVTADGQGGFEDVLVVRNAAAARSPALRSFSFRPAVSGGLVLRADSHGNLTAGSRGGHAFFEIPAAVMWDSRTPSIPVPAGTDPAYGRKVDLRDGQPVTSAAAGPGEDARTALVGTSLRSGILTYTPDQSILAGKSTVYPVYIDPAAGSERQYWAQADNTWPTQTYPKPSPMQVGYNGWQSPYFTARSFVRESVPSIIKGASTDIESSTLYLTDEYAPACDSGQGDFGVQVWATGAIGSGTDWDSQPSWNTEESEKSFAHGYDSSCPAASAGFPVTGAMASAAHSSQPNVTFGIRADNESDPYGWKQFSDTVTLSTTFDKAPYAPSDLKTSPATSCTAATPTTVGNGDVTLYATLSDPLGSAAGSLTATVSVTDMTTGAHMTGSPFTIKNLGSGSIATVLLTESALKAMSGAGISEFAWSATATDGTLTSPVSSTCHFDFDPSSPGAPTVTAQDTTYTIGTPATFAVTPDASGVTPDSYRYQVNGGAIQAQAASSGGDATLTVTPASGADALTVTAISAGGNVGQSATVFFTAAAPANAADGDLTGDGVPDLVTPGGGSSGLAPGLWLARGEEAGGGGNGQVSPTATDIGAEGDGIAGDYSPADFTGSQVITGLFSDDGFQDSLIYFPPGSGSYSGAGVVLDGTGDGTSLDDQGMYAPGDSALTTQISAGALADANGDNPLQVANGYNADPNDNPAYPDLIAVNGDPANGYYLAYYQNASIRGTWTNPDMLSTPTPDGTMDWNNWRIATMQDPAPGYADMFLYDPSTSALYLWQDLTVDDFYDTASYTQYQLSADWNPGTVSELRAADITGTGPALWATTTAGAVTAWTAGSLNATAGTGTITAAGPAQSLLTPAHAWQLADATSGTASTAADQPGPGTTADDLTGTSGVAWNSGGLLSPDTSFNGSSGYMTSAAAAVTTNQSFTVSAWVRPSALGGTVFSQNGALYSGFTVSSTTGGKWQAAMNGTDTSTSSYSTATGGTAADGMWARLTLTYDTAGGADILKLYVNGTEVLSLADTSPPDATGKFLLGGAQSAGTAASLFTGQIADVKAWDTLAVPLQPATPGSAFVPVTPVRIMDTSSGSQVGPVTGPVAAHSTTTLAIDGNTTAGLPAAGITAAAVAITVTHPSNSGFLTAYPDGASLPVTSTVNWPGGTSAQVTNNAIVPVGPDGKIALYNSSSGTIQLVVDLTGYFTTTTSTTGASSYTTLAAPVHILDTRNGTGAPQAPLGPDQVLTLPIEGNTTNGAGVPAAGVTAVALNITAYAGSSTGWLQAYPDGTSRPGTVSLSFSDNDQDATVLVPVGPDGKIDLYNGSPAPIDITGDLSGYFTAGTGGQLYHPLDSTRILDTRQTAAIPADTGLTVPVPASVPADNPVLILNMTATGSQDAGYLKAYPSTSPPGAGTIVNFAADQTIPNLALVNTATGNALTVENASPGTVQAVLDTNGYFS